MDMTVGTPAKKLRLKMYKPVLDINNEKPVESKYRTEKPCQEKQLIFLAEYVIMT